MCLPFPPVAQRQEAMEEALSVVQGLWTEETFSFEGKYFRLDQARLVSQAGTTAACAHTYRGWGREGHATPGRSIC